MQINPSGSSTPSTTPPTSPTPQSNEKGETDKKMEDAALSVISLTALSDSDLTIKTLERYHFENLKPEEGLKENFDTRDLLKTLSSNSLKLSDFYAIYPFCQEKEKQTPGYVLFILLTCVKEKKECILRLLLNHEKEFIAWCVGQPPHLVQKCVEPFSNLLEEAKLPPLSRSLLSLINYLKPKPSHSLQKILLDFFEAYLKNGAEEQEKKDLINILIFYLSSFFSKGTDETLKERLTRILFFVFRNPQFGNMRLTLMTVYLSISLQGFRLSGPDHTLDYLAKFLMAILKGRNDPQFLKELSSIFIPFIKLLSPITSPAADKALFERFAKLVFSQAYTCKASVSVYHELLAFLGNLCAFFQAEQFYIHTLSSLMQNNLHLVCKLITGPFSEHLNASPNLRPYWNPFYKILVQQDLSSLESSLQFPLALYFLTHFQEADHPTEEDSLITSKVACFIKNTLLKKMEEMLSNRKFHGLETLFNAFKWLLALRYSSEHEIYHLQEAGLKLIEGFKEDCPPSNESLRLCLQYSSSLIAIDTLPAIWKTIEHLFGELIDKDLADLQEPEFKDKSPFEDCLDYSKTRLNALLYLREKVADSKFSPIKIATLLRTFNSFFDGESICPAAFHALFEIFSTVDFHSLKPEEALVCLNLCRSTLISGKEFAVPFTIVFEPIHLEILNQLFNRILRSPSVSSSFGEMEITEGLDAEFPTRVVQTVKSDHVPLNTKFSLLQEKIVSLTADQLAALFDFFYNLNPSENIEELWGCLEEGFYLQMWQALKESDDRTFLAKKDLLFSFLSWLSFLYPSVKLPEIGHELVAEIWSRKQDNKAPLFDLSIAAFYLPASSFLQRAKTNFTLQQRLTLTPFALIMCPKDPFLAEKINAILVKSIETLLMKMGEEESDVIVTENLFPFLKELNFILKNTAFSIRTDSDPSLLSTFLLEVSQEMNFSSALLVWGKEFFRSGWLPINLLRTLFDNIFSRAAPLDSVQNLLALGELAEKNYLLPENSSQVINQALENIKMTPGALQGAVLLFEALGWLAQKGQITFLTLQAVENLSALLFIEGQYLYPFSAEQKRKINFGISKLREAGCKLPQEWSTLFGNQTDFIAKRERGLIHK